MDRVTLLLWDVDPYVLEDSENIRPLARFVFVHILPFYLHCGTSNWRLEQCLDMKLLLLGAKTDWLHPQYTEYSSDTP